jgi:hypothetical protein
VAATQVEADIQKVIALLPTAVQIAGSILNIVAAAEGNSAPGAALLSTVQNASGPIQSDLTSANSLVAQYQTDLASARPVLWGKLMPPSPTRSKTWEPFSAPFTLQVRQSLQQ